MTLWEEEEHGWGVGNRPDGVATASCLYTNRRPGERSREESTFPIRSETPDLDLTPLTSIG